MYQVPCTSSFNIQRLTFDICERYKGLSTNYLPIGRQAKFSLNAYYDRNENYSFRYQLRHPTSRIPYFVLCT
jgi:hypothetical protein